jgi:hypothetical protein
LFQIEIFLLESDTETNSNDAKRSSEHVFVLIGVVPVIETVANALGQNLELNYDYSSETITRAACEQNVAIDLELIDKINASECIGVGYVCFNLRLFLHYRIDETPHQRLPFICRNTLPWKIKGE